MSAVVSQDELRLRTRLIHDHEFFCFCCLKIKDKESAKFIPFKFNPSQRYAFQRADAQRRSIGKVRQIRLKARQEGCSTGIQSRLFWFVIHNEGSQAFTMAHNWQTTDALFKMAKIFYEMCPEQTKPHLGKSNESEMSFDKWRSTILCATAGESTQGRGTTNHFFHGSEIAYWKNGEEHVSGIMNSVPTLGSEIYLESTANGTDNIFYELWQKASKGGSEFQATFTPWFWMPDYQMPKPIDGNLLLDSDEKDYQKQYKLTLPQMYWRRMKINDANSKNRDGTKEFDREFPASPAVAFNVSKANGFIKPELIDAAMNCPNAPYGGVKVMGFDVAGEGRDFNAVVVRQGRIADKLKLWQSDDTTVSTSIVANMIKQEKPARVFVDSTGIGKGVFDNLRNMFGNIIESVNSASAAIDSNTYSNKRAEMWAHLKEWLVDYPCVIPSDESIKIALSAVEYVPDGDSKNRLLMAPKENIRKVLGHSPDAADALALTFARPVRAANRETKKSNYAGIV